MLNLQSCPPLGHTRGSQPAIPSSRRTLDTGDFPETLVSGGCLASVALSVATRGSAGSTHFQLQVRPVNYSRSQSGVNAGCDGLSRRPCPQKAEARGSAWATLDPISPLHQCTHVQLCTTEGNEFDKGLRDRIVLEKNFNWN